MKDEKPFFIKINKKSYGFKTASQKKNLNPKMHSCMDDGKSSWGGLFIALIYCRRVVDMSSILS